MQAFLLLLAFFFSLKVSTRKLTTTKSMPTQQLKRLSIKSDKSTSTYASTRAAMVSPPPPDSPLPNFR